MQKLPCSFDSVAFGESTGEFFGVIFFIGVAFLIIGVTGDLPGIPGGVKTP
jgi:hypothetical protein